MNTKFIPEFIVYKKMAIGIFLALLVSTITLGILFKKQCSNYDLYRQSSVKLISGIRDENIHVNEKISKLVSQISNLKAEQDSVFDEELSELVRQSMISEKTRRFNMLDYMEASYATEPAIMSQLSEIHPILYREKVFSPIWNETVARFDKLYCNSLKANLLLEGLALMHEMAINDSTDPEAMSIKIKDIEASQGLSGLIDFLTSLPNIQPQSPYVKYARVIAVLPYSHRIILDDGSLYEVSEYNDFSVMRWKVDQGVNVHDRLPATPKGFNGILFSRESPDDSMLVKKIGFVNLN